MVDDKWGRRQSITDKNHTLDCSELCVVDDLGIHLDVGSSTRSRKKYLGMVTPIFYCPGSYLSGFCADSSTKDHLKQE